MLLPAIVTLHWLRRRLAEPALSRVPTGFLALATALIVALVALRTYALQGLGGYHRPTAEAAVWNYLVGLDRVFRLVPPDRAWQPLASWFVTLLPLAALLCWHRAAPHTRFLLVAGAAVSALFNLPFLLVTKIEQLHLITLGAVLVLASSTLAVVEAQRVRTAAVGIVLMLAAGSAALVAVARDVSRDFDPFGAIVLSHDRHAEGWAAVPHEIRHYLATKQRTGARVSENPAEALDLVFFGAHPPEHDPAGVRIRWMSSNRTELLVTTRAREVLIALRHEAGAFREPAFVEIRANGRRLDSLELRDGAWRMSRIPLRGGDPPWFWRMHRVVVSLPHAWVPAEIIPGSTDTRVLGLQIGDPQIR